MSRIGVLRPAVVRAIFAGLALIGAMVWAGCATTHATGPVLPASAPAEPVDLFAPPAPPNGFDPERATAELSKIPDDPPAPEASAEAVPELPRQARRRMAEARRLFGQQRFSETILEAEQALRYNSRNAEALRLAALSALLSGKEKEARLYAESTLEIAPDDLAAHYVLGRLAQKADQPQAALQAFRTALKCPVPEGFANYKTLTHYSLGLLLGELGYYRASIGQLEAFEQAVASIDPERLQDAELSTILRVKRTVPLLALAEAHEALGRFGAAADALARAIDPADDADALRVRLIKNLVRAKRFDDARLEAHEHVTAGQAAAGQTDPEAAELLLAVYRAAGRANQGLAAIERLVDEHPDDERLTDLLVNALLASRRFDRAVQVLDAYLARHRDATRMRWNLVAIHRFRGDYRQWLEAIADQLAAEQGESTRAVKELAQVETDAARRLVDKAIRERRRPTDSAPADATAARTDAARFFALGWLADRLNRVEDAHNLFVRSLEADGAFAPAVIGMAELYINRCQWQKALEVARGVESDDNTLLAALDRLAARCYDGLDMHDKAVEHYQSAIKQNPDDTDAMLMLAKLFDRTGEPAKAAAVYEAIIQKNPREVEARERLVMNLLNRWNEPNNLKQALTEVKNLQDQAPDHPATTRVMALVKLLMHQPPDLENYVRVLRSLVEAQPGDLQSRQVLCSALLRTGDYDEARRHVMEMLDRSPYSSQANELLAVVAMRQLRIEEAADQLERCLEWYPNREMFLRSLGEVHLVQQDYSGAERVWQRLLSLENAEPRTAYYAGRLFSTYLQAGWHDKARAAAEKWLESADDEQQEMYRTYLLAADAAAGQFDRYIERCREWLESEPADQEARAWLLGIAVLPGDVDGGLIAAGRRDEAVALATAWVAEAPAEPLWSDYLIRTLQAVRRPADLIEICRANLAASDKPQEQLMALQRLADAYVVAENYDEAIQMAKRLAIQAAQIAGGELTFQLDQMMISFLAQAKRFDDAIALGNKLLGDLDARNDRLVEMAVDESDTAKRMQINREQEKMREQRAEVLRSLSFVHMQENHRDEALECLRQAIALSPDDAGLNNDLGYTLADAGMELDTAERMLKKAVAEVLWNGVGADMHQAAFTDSLGWLYYKQGRFIEARRWLALAAKMENGEDAVIHDHLGDVEWRLGNRKAARQGWQRCLELHERAVEAGTTHRDDKLVERIKSKLAATDGEGDKPPVATSTAD